MIDYCVPITTTQPDIPLPCLGLVRGRPSLWVGTRATVMDIYCYSQMRTSIIDTPVVVQLYLIVLLLLLLLILLCMLWHYRTITVVYSNKVLKYYSATSYDKGSSYYSTTSYFLVRTYCTAFERITGSILRVDRLKRATSAVAVYDPLSRAHNSSTVVCASIRIAVSCYILYRTDSSFCSIKKVRYLYY